MYERNAIVIDRYFANLFGYDQSNNLKNNSNNYFELVSKLEEYQIAVENENNVMQEYESVANKIRETQRIQETLNKRNQKYFESRKALFDNLDEDADTLRNKFNKVEDDILKNDQEIRENIDKFVDETRQFHEKTEIRTECGRERRIIESEYQKILNRTTENFTKINKERLKEIKSFVKSDNKTQEKDKIREKILKNGAKEKIPFDTNVINKAIDVSTDIEQKKVEILLSIYDKTGKLLDEIKNDNIKIERHKKIVKDSQSKLEYLNVIGEYVVLFLDNERMNTIGGEKEHQKIMKDACENVKKDLIEIQNMYALLIKEITDKSSKKAYKELYNLGYLYDLQDEESRFEANISKLNMTGTVIYPEHWRIEGLQKLYETFKHLITDVYEKDITEYEPIDVKTAINEDILKVQEDDDIIEDIEEDNNKKNEEKNIKEDKKDKKEVKKEVEPEEIIDEEPEDDDEEFQWDDEDIDDELKFEDSPIFEDDEDDEDDEEEATDDENDEEEADDEIEEVNFDDELDSDDEEKTEIEDEDEKRDEEIDKILGFFDEADEDDANLLDLDDEDEKEEITDVIDDDYEILSEQDDQDETENKSSKKGKEKKEKKKMSLFGRKKK